MAAIMAIELSANGLWAVELRGSGRQALATATLATPLKKHPEPENAAALGTWLRGLLAQRDFHATQAVVMLGRELVTLKSIRLPLCPEDELPGMMALSAESEWPQLAADSVVEFQAGQLGSEQRDILVARTARDVVETIRIMIQAAGLRLRCISLSAFGIEALSDRLAEPAPKTAGEPSLLRVVDTGHALDLSLWTGRSLRLARHFRLDGEDQLTRDLQRKLLAFHAHSPNA